MPASFNSIHFPGERLDTVIQLARGDAWVNQSARVHFTEQILRLRMRHARLIRAGLFQTRHFTFRCGKQPSGDWCADRFRLGIKIEHLMAHFAAPAGLLVSAERHGRIENAVAVDPDRSRAKFGRDTMRLLDVPRPDGRREAKLRVVGLRDQIVHVAERHDRHDWSENFLAHDLHLLVGVDEHRGLDEIAFVAFAAAANGGLRAFGQPGFEIAANAVELFLGDERSHLARGFHSGTDANLRRELRDAVHDFVELFVFDVEPRTSATHLALIEEDGVGGAGNGAVDFRVLENDVGDFPPSSSETFFKFPAAA